MSAYVPSRAWVCHHGRHFILVDDTYGEAMMVALDVRKQAFSAFVKRATDHAKFNRGWSIPRIEEESRRDGAPGLSANTIYRWIRTEFTDWPEPETVVAFCDTLDIPPVTAFVIMWPGKDGRPQAPAPFLSDPDLELLQRKLNDPKTSRDERYHIRETVRGLALRGR